MAVLDNIWGKPLPADKTVSVLAELSDPVDYYTVLRIALNTVYLEGPAGIRDTASKLQRVFMKEIKMVSSLTAKNYGKHGNINDLIDWGKLITERIDAKNDFIDEGINALGISPGWRIL